MTWKHLQDKLLSEKSKNEMHHATIMVKKQGMEDKTCVFILAGRVLPKRSMRFESDIGMELDGGGDGLGNFYHAPLLSINVCKCTAHLIKSKVLFNSEIFEIQIANNRCLLSRIKAE